MVNKLLFTHLLFRAVTNIITQHQHASSMTDEIFSVWRHQMETFSSLIVLCTGVPPVIVGFPSQGPVRRGFDGSLICTWAIGWVNSDFRRHCSRHDVIVLCWRVGVERWSISTVVLYYEMLNTNVKYKHKAWPWPHPWIYTSAVSTTESTKTTCMEKKSTVVLGKIKHYLRRKIR